VERTHFTKGISSAYTMVQSDHVTVSCHMTHPLFSNSGLENRDRALGLVSFPGSPKNGGGEPGIDSHVISRHDAVSLLNNLKRHSREDREVAAKYSQVRSLLLQLFFFCCVAILKLKNVAAILFLCAKCSANQP